MSPGFLVLPLFPRTKRVSIRPSVPLVEADCSFGALSSACPGFPSVAVACPGFLKHVRPTILKHLLSLLKKFIYSFLERGGEWEKERERNISWVPLPLTRAPTPRHVP